MPAPLQLLFHRIHRGLADSKTIPRIRGAGTRPLASGRLSPDLFRRQHLQLAPAYAKSLCDLLAREKLDLTWRCILYPGNVDESLVTAMARAGCEDVSLGFESGSQPVLDGMRKGFDTREIRRTAQMLGGAGIGRMGFLLLGGPDETKETVQESLEFVDSLHLEMVKVTIGIRIYPDTRLAEIARQQGVIGSGDDLLQPRFYLTPGLERWLRETLAEWMTTRGNWIM